MAQKLASWPEILDCLDFRIWRDRLEPLLVLKDSSLSINGEPHPFRGSKTKHPHETYSSIIDFYIFLTRKDWLNIWGAVIVSNTIFNIKKAGLC